MWERFSFYGMKAVFVLFLVLPVAQGGLGFTDKPAGQLFAIYSSLVYFSNLPGGWIADRLLGLRRAVLVGGIIIMLGHICLTFHALPLFYTGLALIIIGTGFLKPNMSSMVGQLYGPADQRRDAGFSIYYMGINLGATIAPLVTGTLAQGTGFRAFLESLGIDPRDSWHFGFGAAAVGMFLGLVQYVWGGRFLADVGKKPKHAYTPAEGSIRRQTLFLALAAILGLVGLAVAGAWTGYLHLETINTWLGMVLLAIPVVCFAYLLFLGDFTLAEKKRIGVLAALFFFSTLFFGGLEQGGGTLLLFASRNTDCRIGSWAFPASYSQFLNPVMVILLSPVFAWLWLRLGKWEPSSPAKFALALFLICLAFIVMTYAARLSESGGALVSPFWLVLVFLVITLAELCISPVGLSMVTRLAPARAVGQLMGIWFIGNALGNYLAGQAITQMEHHTLTEIFAFIAVACLAAGLLLVALLKPIRRMMNAGQSATAASSA
jgi:POT family proton-dependent oligopeptide transporter